MTLTSGVCWENRIGWMTVAHGANIGDEIHYMDPINDGGGLLYRLGQVTHRSYTPETDAALITRGTGVSVGATNLFPNGTAVHLMGGTPDKDTYVHTYGTYSGYQYSKVIESVDAAAFLDGELRDDLIIVNQTCMSGDSGSPLLHTVGNERSLSGSLWLDVFAGNGTVYTAYGKMNHVISTWRDFSTTAY